MLTSTGRFTAHWKGNYLVWNYIRFLFNQSREIIVVWFLSDPHFTPYWKKEPIYHQQHIQWVCDSNIRTIEWDHLMWQPFNHMYHICEKRASREEIFSGRIISFFAITFLFLKILEWSKNVRVSEVPSLNMIQNWWKKYQPSRSRAF